MFLKTVLILRIFTSHYVSINSIQQPQSVGQLLQDLHPTMYLLILTLQRQGIQVSVFTSHYVSINSRGFHILPTCRNIFTSHYVSINSIFLISLQHFLVAFTSHYVSINSQLFHLYNICDRYLHPTMYLLIRVCPLIKLMNTSHLHPTMYLLILVSASSSCNILINLHPTMYLLILIH